LDSCTKETKAAKSYWLGDPMNTNATIVDTPGFGDSQGKEVQETLIEEMMTVLNQEIQTAGAIVLHIKGRGFTRIDNAMHNTLKTMTALFGSGVWRKLIINVGWFAYDQASANRRLQQCTYGECKDESWFRTKISEVLVREYGENIKGFNLTFTFIDSFAKQKYNKDDVLQQGNFTHYSNVLLNFAQSSQEYKLRTINDLIQENTDFKAEVTHLNDEQKGSTARIRTLLDDKDKLENQNYNYSLELTNSETEVRALEDHLGDVTKEKHIFKNNSEYLDTKLKELNEQIRQQTAKNTLNLANLAQTLLDLEADLRNVTKEKNIYKNNSESLNTKLNVFKQQIRQQKSNNANLTQVLRNTEASLNETTVEKDNGKINYYEMFSICVVIL
jgi:predicted RNA-binding protein with RPS1 domain